MTSRLQVIRSSTPGQRPAPGARAPGELWLNFADQAFGYINAVGAPIDLISPSIYLPRAGGEMTGFLTLHANPVDALHAAPKQYVDTRVLRAGDTMTGALGITHNGAAGAPSLRLATVGDTRIAGLYAVEGTGAVDALRVALAGVAAADVYPAGTGVPTTATVLTREKGDARYLQLTGGTLSSTLTIGSGGQLIVDRNGGNIELRNPAGPSTAQIGVSTTGTILFAPSGSNAAVVEAVGTSVPNVTSLITREKGDARYLRLTGGALSGGLSFGTQSVASRIDLSRHIDVYGGVFGFSVTNLGADFNIVASGPSIYFVVNGGNVGARADASGAAANFALTLITREKGDARYAQLASANTMSANNVFNGNNTFNGITGFNSTGNNAIVVNSTVDAYALAIDRTGTLNSTRQKCLVMITDTSGGTSDALQLINSVGRAAAITNAGNVVSTGAVTVISDARTKTNIVDLELGLPEVLALRPCSFTRISTEETEIGFIAQEVEAVAPSMIQRTPVTPEDPDPLLGLRESQMIALLVKAMQQLAGRVEALEAA